VDRRIPPTRSESAKIQGFHPKNTGFTLFIYSPYLINLLAAKSFGPRGKNKSRRNSIYRDLKRNLRETSQQGKESRENSFTEGGALGSETGHNGQMADEKSRRHDCLSQSTRSIGDF
jgi:hypothetical protein